MEKVDLNDLEQPNKKGRSALHFAARLSLFYIYPNLVKLLMTQGSLFNDHFPLHLKKVSCLKCFFTLCSSRYSLFQLTRYLVEVKKMNAESEGEDGMTPILYVCR